MFSFFFAFIAISWRWLVAIVCIHLLLYFKVRTVCLWNEPFLLLCDTFLNPVCCLYLRIWPLDGFTLIYISWTADFLFVVVFHWHTPTWERILFTDLNVLSNPRKLERL